MAVKWSVGECLPGHDPLVGFRLLIVLAGRSRIGGVVVPSQVFKRSTLKVIQISERLCFWGAPHIFQIKYSVNMSGKVDLLKT